MRNFATECGQQKNGQVTAEDGIYSMTDAKHRFIVIPFDSYGNKQFFTLFWPSHNCDTKEQRGSKVLSTVPGRIVHLVVSLKTQSSKG